jgi:hypothetical protein
LVIVVSPQLPQPQRLGAARSVESIGYEPTAPQDEVDDVPVERQVR